MVIRSYQEERYR